MNLVSGMKKGDEFCGEVGDEFCTGLGDEYFARVGERGERQIDRRRWGNWLVGDEFCAGLFKWIHTWNLRGLEVEIDE